MNNDLISRSALRARFQEILDRGDMFCEYDIIGMLDNAPTVERPIKGIAKTNKNGEVEIELLRPQEVNCSNCDYFKFSQSFIENVVEFMTENNIETVEDLTKELNRINELLGGAKND